MPLGDTTSERTEWVAKQIVDAAFKVHQEMRPGLLESVYEACLFHELTKRGLKVERQVTIPVVYDGVKLDVGFRVDLLVENLIIIELKAVEKMEPIFQAVLQDYLRLARKRVGFPINFNVVLFTDGIKRIVV